MHNVAQLRRLHELFPAQMVAIGVHSAKFPSEGLTANIKEATRRYGIQHPVVNDAGFQIWNAYAIHAWPTVVLINPQGKIVHTESGEIDASEWIPRIEALLSSTETAGSLPSISSAFIPPETLLSYPTKVLLTPDLRLFIADTGHHRILETRLDPLHHLAEVQRSFGSGEAGFRDGPARQAAFDRPRGLALHEGSLYVADTGNHSLRTIDLSSGNVLTMAGTGQKGTGRYTPGEPAEISLRSPWALFALPGGSPASEPILFIAMAGSHQVWVYLPDHRLGVFAGNGREALIDGALPQASFNQPSDLAFGVGHLFVADAEASAVRAISLGADQKVFTLIGMGLFEFGDIDGSGTQARLQHPSGLAFGGQGSPQGEEAVSGLLYVADSYNHKIKTLDPFTAQANRLIGTGKPGSADGPFEQAELYEPEGVAIQGQWLVIADTNNHLIRLADLQTKLLHTIMLTRLDRIQSSPHSPESLRLEPVRLAQENAQVIFNIMLPEGYKLNPESPVTIRQGREEPFQVFTYPPGEPVLLPVQVRISRELNLELTLYYCQEENARLCLIHDRRLILPVRVEPNAPSTVQVIYHVEEGGPFAQPSA